MALVSSFFLTLGKMLKCDTMCVCNSSIDCSCLSQNGQVILSGVRKSVVHTLAFIKHLQCLYAFTMCCRAVLNACSPQNAQWALIRNDSSVQDGALFMGLCSVCQ